VNRRTNILLASLALTALLLSGTFQQSASDPLYRSFQSAGHPFMGPIYPSFSSWSSVKSTLIAALDEESEGLTADKNDDKDGKDEEDGALKELWASVLLG